MWVESGEGSERNEGDDVDDGMSKERKRWLQFGGTLVLKKRVPDALQTSVNNHFTHSNTLVFETGGQRGVTSHPQSRPGSPLSPQHYRSRPVYIFIFDGLCYWRFL